MLEFCCGISSLVCVLSGEAIASVSLVRRSVVTMAVGQTSSASSLTPSCGLRLASPLSFYQWLLAQLALLHLELVSSDPSLFPRSRILGRFPFPRVERLALRLCLAASSVSTGHLFCRSVLHTAWCSQEGGDDMRDALMLHLTNGACAVHSPVKDPLCLSVVQKYMLHSETCNSAVLKVRILDGPSSKLAKLQKTLRTYVGRLKLLQESYSADALQTEWPSVVLDQRKTEIVQSFRVAMSSAGLKTFVCASCSAKRCLHDISSVPIEDIDLNLLKRPDVRVVDGTLYTRVG
ncbi:hypothetical protein HD554DRAFT_2137092 [Boletus coccyginus]|nr:hypothetical protein HD554DRAFT_2137092 [Boletus coccyginus]